MKSEKGVDEMSYGVNDDFGLHDGEKNMKMVVFVRSVFGLWDEIGEINGSGQRAIFSIFFKSRPI